jgi:hypothetical protein
LKGIIVEMHKKYVIIATRDGYFKKVCNRYADHSVGDEIDVPQKSILPFDNPFHHYHLVGVAVIICILIGLGGFAIYDYSRPVAFVTLDINPSIELSLNRYERVIDIRGLNTDGDDIVSTALTVKNLRIEDALKELLQEIASRSYMDWQSSTVFLTVSSEQEEKSQDLKNKLKDVVESQMESIIAGSGNKSEDEIVETENIITANSVTVIVETTTPQKRSEANKMNVSQGKLFLYERLKKVKPDVKLDDIKKTSISNVIEQMNALSPKDVKGRIIRPEKTDSNNKDKRYNNVKDDFEEIKQYERQEKDEVKQRKKESQQRVRDVKKEVRQNEKAVKREIKEKEKQEEKKVKQREK